MNSLSAFWLTRRVRLSSGSPSAWASSGKRSGFFINSLGSHHTDSTGEDTATGSPLRSVIMPREVGMAISRTKRASPCF